MTDRCPSGRENNEYILGDLNDETPSSSSEEDEKCETVSSTLPATPAPLCSKTEEENFEKFEKNTINKIMAIKSEVEKIKAEIMSLEKEVLERDFKKYEEVLILKTLSLDNIETKGLEPVKQIRKDTIMFVQDCLKVLDSRAK